MIIVADSSPLISLAILNKLNILDKILKKIYIPTAVDNEIVQQNKPYSNELKYNLIIVLLLLTQNICTS